jgi:hypothetical protein
MAEEAQEAPKAPAAAEAENTKVKKKKLRPTNCAQSNKRIRRKDWYYRDGKYFANKQCYHLFVTQAQEKALKEKEKEAAASATAEAKPVAE